MLDATRSVLMPIERFPGYKDGLNYAIRQRPRVSFLKFALIKQLRYRLTYEGLFYSRVCSLKVPSAIIFLSMTEHNGGGRGGDHLSVSDILNCPMAVDGQASPPQNVRKTTIGEICMWIGHGLCTRTRFSMNCQPLFGSGPWERAEKWLGVHARTRFETEVKSQVTHPKRLKMDIKENKTVKSHFTCSLSSLLGFWVVLEPFQVFFLSRLSWENRKALGFCFGRAKLEHYSIILSQLKRNRIFSNDALAEKT